MSTNELVANAILWSIENDKNLDTELVQARLKMKDTVLNKDMKKFEELYPSISEDMSNEEIFLTFISKALYDSEVASFLGI